MPTKKAKKTSKKSTSRSTRTATKKSSRKTTKARNEPVKPSLWSTLTLDRKLDLLGIGMVLLGILTLLSLVSSNNGWLFGGWLAIIGKSFGWGMYLLPLGLIALGLWLILRHFDQLPRLEPGRIIGLLLFYFILLGWLHLFNFPSNRVSILDLAAQSKGGGYLGGALLVILEPNLGLEGAAIALAAGTLIALAFALDMSVPELFGWLTPITSRLRTILDDFFKRISAQGRESLFGEATSPDQTRPPAEPAAGAALASPGLGMISPNEAGEAREWILPDIDQILESGDEVSFDDEFDRQRARLIEDTLASFGAPAKVIEINRGPTITQFGVEPGFIDSRNGQMRVRVSKIAALADDLALTLSAKRIRIQAPVPGKGFVGIEVPNEAISWSHCGMCLRVKLFKV
jgi:S-DNA-T family DNA segregation ATPase FtsK/SpoIIIE